MVETLKYCAVIETAPLNMVQVFHLYLHVFPEGCVILFGTGITIHPSAPIVLLPSLSVYICLPPPQRKFPPSFSFIPDDLWESVFLLANHP